MQQEYKKEKSANKSTNRGSSYYNNTLARWLPVYKNDAFPEAIRWRAKEQLLEINRPKLDYYENYYGTYMRGYFSYGKGTITRKEVRKIVAEKFGEVLERYDFNALIGGKDFDLNDNNLIEAKKVDISKTFQAQMQMIIRPAVLRRIEKANGLTNKDHIQILNRISSEGLDLYLSPMDVLVEIVKDPTKKKTGNKKEVKHPEKVIFKLRRLFSKEYTGLNELVETRLPDKNVDIPALADKIDYVLSIGDLQLYGIEEKERKELARLMKYYLLINKKADPTEIIVKNEKGKEEKIKNVYIKVKKLEDLAVALAEDCIT